MPISTPTGTDWQVATDSDFTDIIVNDVGGGYSLTRQFEQDELPYGVDLYIRARHVHPELGETEWSNPVQFSVAIPVIGICIDNSDASSIGRVYYIDKNGNEVESCDWQNFPTFANMEMAVLDADRAPVTMLKIPKTYYRITNTSNRLRIWLCPEAVSSSYSVCGCFARYLTASDPDNYADYVYIGAYLGHEENIGGVTCIGSKADQSVAKYTITSTSTNIMSSIPQYTLCTNRNNDADGASGFDVFDHCSWGFLYILGLFMYCSTDFSTAAGDDQSTEFTTTGSTKARMIFKGSQENPEIFIDDLWNCQQTWIARIYLTNFSISSGEQVVAMHFVSQSISGGAQYRTLLQAESHDQISLSSGWIRDISFWNVVPAITPLLTSDTNTGSSTSRHSITDDQSLATFTDYAYTDPWGDTSATYFLYVGGNYGENFANTRNGFLTTRWARSDTTATIRLIAH